MHVLVNLHGSGGVDTLERQERILVFLSQEVESAAEAMDAGLGNEPDVLAARYSPRNSSSLASDVSSR